MFVVSGEIAVGYADCSENKSKKVQNIKISAPTIRVEMRGSLVARAVFFLLFALVHGEHKLDYSDLEALGVACPERDRCAGYRGNLTYLDRSCECDSACHAYGDCCIDAPPGSSRTSPETQSPARSDMVCMPYGNVDQAGVYVITHCSSNWNGPEEVREKCETPTVDYSDPLMAAPVTSVAESKTYRNRYCAECNNADLPSLTLFQVGSACNGLQDMPVQQLYAEITYNQDLKLWGVYRVNPLVNATQFHDCEIIFGVPGYLNNSVRFCRSNLISTCPPTWTRQSVRNNCEEYMAVVFDNEHAFRNPHCAICNGDAIGEVSCTESISLGKKRQKSPFLRLLDINNNGNNKEVEIGANCATDHIYDPYAKTCKELKCLPGQMLLNRKCVFT